MFEQTTGMVHKATYNTLVTLKPDDISQVVPDLTQSWDVSPDAKTFTFHLRSGVRFQNSGNPMTAADVKWSIERAIGIKGKPVVPAGGNRRQRDTRRKYGCNHEVGSQP